MLKKSTPYMLNLQGDLTEGEAGRHPYVLDLSSSKSVEDQNLQIDSLLFGGLCMIIRTGLKV